MMRATKGPYSGEKRRKESKGEIIVTVETEGMTMSTLERSNAC